MLTAAACAHACAAQQIASTSCARTTSFSTTNLAVESATGPVVSYASPYTFGRKGGAPGGVMTSFLRKSVLPAAGAAPDLATLDELRCTFSVDTEPKAGGGYDVHIWTVEHCLRPQLTSSLRLSFWDAQARTYRVQEASLAAIDRMTTLNAESASLALPVREALAASLSLTNSGVENASTDMCKQATAAFLADDAGYPGYDASTHTVICGSAMDLARMKVRFVTPPSAELKALLDGWHATLTAAKAGLAQFLPFTSLNPTQKALAANWRVKIDSITAQRAASDIDALVDRVNACNFSSGDPLCTAKGAIMALPTFQAAFSAAAGRTGTLIARKAAITMLEDEISVGFSLVDEIPEHQENFQIQVNSTRLADSANVDRTAPIDPANLNGFMTLPLSKSLTPGAAVTIHFYPMTVAGRKLSAVMAFPRNRENVKFHPGDSGGTLSYLGVLPVGTLSTVDGEPTSGGFVVRTLPQGQAPSGGGAPAAGAPGANDAGTDAPTSSPKAGMGAGTRTKDAGTADPVGAGSKSASRAPDTTSNCITR